MVTAKTKGVKVTVSTEYQERYSNPGQSHYVFTYKVIIENHASTTFKLLSRFWNIVDVGSKIRQISGEGVVGQKPIIVPGGRHEYVAGCNLVSGIGKMFGYYLMERIIDGAQIRVEIPTFTMVSKDRLN